MPDKFKSENASGARVRFAPAPTGFLHVGSCRTALFNWLFSKKYGGKFILRLEDTDKERSRPEFEKDIMESLRWLGLDWDEGPDIGGPYGPYRQSQRLPLYENYLKRLLEEDRAYYCFCSEEDLANERRDMLSRGIQPKYSGRCRVLAPETARKYVAEGRKHIIRFKMPQKTITFEDLVRGKISFDGGAIGDFAIARSLSSPLFIFAVTVDDFEMRISHVIRGEDLLPNVPKQIALQEALGFSSPRYAHLPMLLGEDRSKLSKRHGATAVAEYRKMGYLPEAMINFLALLGWHPPGDREIFSKEELIREFSLSRVQKSGAIFNPVRLNWFNAYYLRKKSDEELLEILRPYWQEAGYLEEGSGGMFPEEKLLEIINLERNRLKTAGEIVSLTEFFFRAPRSYSPDLLVWKKSTKEETLSALQKIIAVVEEVPEESFSVVGLGRAMESLYGSDKGTFLWPFRVALSGREASPGPFEIAAILGKTETLKRLHYAKNLLAA